MKRIAELRQLSRDHQTGLALAQKCKGVSRPNSTLTVEALAEEVLEAFRYHLEPHFQIEERHLLPALEAIGEASFASRIREDHALLRASRDSGLSSREQIARFGEFLDAHIRFEERVVFEATQDRLPANALEAIAVACDASTA